MSSRVKFHRKPIPWIYSRLGAIIFTAILRLHPTQRELNRLEVKNLRDYFFSKRFWRNPVLKTLSFGSVVVRSYWSALGRLAALSKSARQDYFALNRFGCFSVELDTALQPREKSSRELTPLLIVPGLNTPSVFFREMHAYFSDRGYPVSVMTMPEKGLSDLSTASQAMEEQIELLKTKYQATQVNVIGHCLGGLVGQHFLEKYGSEDETPIRNFVTLGTGFLGAEGVKTMKAIWTKNHPKMPIPKVFDQLIQGGTNVAHRAERVFYHNFVTIWDFVVHFQKGILKKGMQGLGSWKGVTNHIFDDPDIDHITLALSPKVFKKIEDAFAA